MTSPELRALFATAPCHRALDAQIFECDREAGRVVVVAPRTELVERGAGSGVWHGGVIALLADAAATFAAIQAVGRPVPTIDLRLDFLRPATTERLYARAAVRRIGRSIATVDVEIGGESGPPCALARGNWSVVPAEPHA